MKTAALFLALATFAFAGCGGSDGGEEPAEKSDFETIQKASDFSSQSSEKADLAIAALGQGDIETATTEVDEAKALAEEARTTLDGVESDPVRLVFTRINDLTLEGYTVLARGIDAAARGDEKATDRYAKEAIAIRNRKLRFVNETDFESIGAGESNEKVREALIEQLRSEAAG